MKRQTAKEILAASFRELARENSVDKITVRAVTENCGYSPATFYRYFKDKYDLIAWDYACHVGVIMDRADGGAWRRSLRDGVAYFAEQKDYLGNLFLHTTGMDSFIHNMTETNYACLRRCVAAASGTEPDEETEMCLRLYCHGTAALTCEWVLGKYGAGPDQLVEVFEKSLPAPLRACLCNE